jgi:hypothetical protein
MDQVENLMKVMNILDTQWGKLTSNLTTEQLSDLKLEFSELENKMKSIKDIDEINDLSSNFIQMFSKMESLKFLANIDKASIRSGYLPELMEEMRIKIINYCVILQEKISSMEEEKATN